VDLLTKDSSKLKKAEALGYHNYAVYLQPTDLSGWNVCSHATEGCRRACLNLSGLGAVGHVKRLTFDDVAAWNHAGSVQTARQRRTRLLMEMPHQFFKQLEKELKAAVKRGTKEKKRVALRLNGTSDLDWDQPKWKSLFDIEAFCKREGIERYEYTKVPNRWKTRPEISWTYSLNEDPNSERWASDYLANGFNCAVVFRDGPPASFSIAGKDFTVINGDEHDLRFADPRPCVVGLKAKGWAKQDLSGFVR